MLLGNYSVHARNPIRFMGGSMASPEVNHWSNFARGGAIRNRQCVDRTSAGNQKFSIPSGCYPPYAKLLPQRGGELSSRRGSDLGLAATAAGVRGLPGAGAADLSILTNTPAGELIVSGAGAASLAIDANAPLLTASVNGAGSAALDLTLNAPILGAIASMLGTSAISVDFDSASMLPVDDASPLRTGIAAMMVGGSLERYAIGHLSGSTDDVQELTADGIAGAVWSVLAADVNVPGTTGAKLNSASAAGDPWTAEVPGTYPAGSAGELLGNLVAGLTTDQAAQLSELWRLAGLDSAVPLVVTQTARTVGPIVQDIAELSGVVTVTRQ